MHVCYMVALFPVGPGNKANYMAELLTVFQVTFCSSKSDGTSNRIICLNIHKDISSLHPWTVIYEAHNRLYCRISCSIIIMSNLIIYTSTILLASFTGIATACAMLVNMQPKLLHAIAGDYNQEVSFIG